MGLQCRVCNSPKTEIINQASANEKSKRYGIHYCTNCDTFFLDAQSQDIIKHLDGRGYTNLQKEESWKSKRLFFFKYLISVVNNYKKPTKWLDYGCAYGHLLEYLQTTGIYTSGTEINQRLSQYCREKGLQVVSDINSLPEDLYFNVISAIDSFYYDPNPTITAKNFYNRLENNGILILRITNRNWLMKVYRLLNKKNLDGVLGDAFVSYSKKSITMLLKASGFEEISFHYLEKGKKHSLGHQVFYNLTNLVAIASFYRLVITPGIIVVARKVAK